MICQKSHIVERVLRCILGCVLIISAVLKSVNVNSFAQEVQQYSDLYLLDSMHGWSNGIAFTVCTFELFIGILTIMRLYRLLTGVTLVIMFSLFLYLTGINLFFPSEYFRSIESCGCFGELIHFTPMTSFIKSVILWIMSIVFFFFVFPDICIKSFVEQIEMMVRDVRTYILLMLSCLPSWFSVHYMESINNHIYIIVYVALCLIVLTCAAIMFLRKR